MKKPGFDMPVDALERFKRFCDDGGLVQWRVAVVALDLFQRLTPALRDEAMRQGANRITSWLARNPGVLGESGIEEVLEGIAEPPADQPRGRRRHRSNGGSAA